MVLLGVAPYITASIIMQLMQTIFPALEKLYKEEGEQGRQKFNMWTRWLTVPLAALQSFSMISLLRSQNILTDITPFTIVVIILSATAGTVFLMWLGELITEKGWAMVSPCSSLRGSSQRCRRGLAALGDVGSIAVLHLSRLPRAGAHHRCGCDLHQ